MQLALLFGSNGDRIKDKYRAMHDDIICDCYRSITDFIAACEARGIVYDRVIMVSSVLKPTADKDFELLEDFVRSTPATVYVMIAKKDVDDIFAQKFVNSVNSSAAVAMLVTSTTQITLEEALTLSPDDINSKYGCVKQQSVEFEREDYVPVEEPKKVEEEIKPQSEPVKPAKKKNFFARLREANQMLKQQKEEAEAKARELAKSQISENSEISDGEVTSEYTPEEEVDCQEVENSEVLEGNTHEEEDYTDEEQYSDGEDVDYEELEIADSSEEIDENYEETLPLSSSDEELDDDDDSAFFAAQADGFTSEDTTLNEADDFSETLSDDLSEFATDDSEFFAQVAKGSALQDDFADLTPIEEPEQITEEQKQTTLLEEKKKSRLAGFFSRKSFKTADESNAVDESLLESVVSSSPLNNEETIEVVEYGIESKSVDDSSSDGFNEDFGEAEPEPVRKPTARPVHQITTDSEVTSKRNVPVVRPSGEIVEVDDSVFDDIDDIIGLDEEYRQEEQKRNVKVVERVVEKEVIKEVKVNGSSKSILSSIFKGKTRKIILVTGARGSGVTTLAYDIANYFAKHCPVLYVDGDTELHGLLNYVDYQRVTDYEANKLQGIRLCRSASAFSNCVIRFDRNLDLLTSDFFVETSDSEYETMQGVITDIARDYGIVVCDIPISKLHLCEELIASGNIILTVEMSQRGYMNLCCEFQSSTLRDKYKRAIVSRGTLALTKCDGKKFTEKDLKRYVSQIVEFEENDADWTSMKSTTRERNITDKFLEEVLEG